MRIIDIELFQKQITSTSQTRFQGEVNMLYNFWRTVKLPLSFSLLLTIAIILCTNKVETVNASRFIAKQGEPASLDNVDSMNAIVWDGRDPFHQPLNTTDYYGSGDINLDGKIDNLDINIAEEIVSGIHSKMIQADVDGDGNITTQDITLLRTVLEGGKLPSWWNQLANRDERNNWIDKMLAIDSTNLYPYRWGWMVCGNFVDQLYINFANYRNDLTYTNYSGGRTKFNMPMYIVSDIPQNPIGESPHAYNAILVGDNPLDYNDWRFIEPQNDTDNRNYRPSSYVSIYADDWISGGTETPPVDTDGQPKIAKVVFKLDESFNPEVIRFSSDFLLSRSEYANGSIDNRPDFWHPTIIPTGNGYILFDGLRNDTDRINDIFITKFPFTDTNSRTSLINSKWPSKLLDAVPDQGGKVHLLWRSTDEYIPGVFYGLLNIDTLTVTNTARLSHFQTPYIASGKIIVTQDGKIHAFWDAWRTAIDTGEIVDQGLYWVQKLTDSWSDEIIISDGVGIASSNYGYLFDGIPMIGNRINLYQMGTMGMSVKQLEFDGINTWKSSVPFTLHSYNVSMDALDAIKDTNGYIHIVISANSYTPSEYHMLSHNVYKGHSWSEMQLLDENGFLPRTIAGNNGEVYLVWEHYTSGRIIPMWSQYKDGRWNSPRTIEPPVNRDGLYPVVNMINGDLVFAWNDYSADRVSIGTSSAHPPLIKWYFLPSVVH